MSRAYELILVLHIASVLLMAAPYYNLVIVSERGRFGAAHLDVDRFFEAVIKGILFRCYFIAWTTVILGVLLVLEHPVLDAGDLLGNWRLLVKLLAWVGIMTVHNYIYFLVQPRIARLLEGAGAGPLDQATAAEVGRLRTQRKMGATTCLFLVLTALVMGPQVLQRFPGEVTLGLVALALLFVVAVYRRGARFGWV